jgi:hypothetical protein
VGETLIRLVYLSKNLIEGDEGAHGVEVDKIMVSSRANNHRAGVTGALVFNDRYFAQILEGPKSAVEATYGRIERDPRHGHIAVIEKKELRQREFGDWSMAYVNPSHGRTEAQWVTKLHDAFHNPPNSHEEVMHMLRHLIGEAA